jgi:hypothetical protein
MKSAASIKRIIRIDKSILLIRNEKVIIDADLAEFYGVTLKRFREQIRRNKNRFPDDFMFKLTRLERSGVVAACIHLSNLKYSRTLPYAFTEHGAIMAAAVLNSEPAIQMSIFIVRAFVKLREVISTHKELAQKVEALERKIAHHDVQITSLIDAIKRLISGDPVPQKRQIGFKALG